MPYLTYEEYNQLGFVDMEEAEFNKLLPKASDVLDSVTRFFYRENDLESDVPIRKEQFKKAVAAQVEYFHETGATTSYGMNEPSTVTIGRTTLSVGSKSSQIAPRNDLISKDVYLYLKETGLLYRGIGVV
ncbi:hypothetical protein NSQ82_07760 [Caldifermentibacillus hisashii]|uniref:hypothetical protein n=1 Tax=Caldifermentibacillus hisashii TaxID=996558 RepID=UPI0031B6CD86